MHPYIRLARDSVNFYLNIHNKPPIFDYCYNRKFLIFKKLKHEFLLNVSTFVTITIEDNLRGCIGSIQKDNIAKNIINNSIDAAFHDNRFEPMSVNEINKAKFEISILDNFEIMQDINNFNLGINGVQISYKNKQALYLPEVGNYFKNKDEFLISLAEKGNMSLNELKAANALKFITKIFKET